MWQIVADIILEKLYNHFRRIFTADETVGGFRVFISTVLLLYESISAALYGDKKELDKSQPKEEESKFSKYLKKALIMLLIIIAFPIVMPIKLVVYGVKNLINTKAFKYFKEIAIEVVNFLTHPTVTSTLNTVTSALVIAGLIGSSILVFPSIVALGIIGYNYISSIVRNVIDTREKKDLLKKSELAELFDQANKELEKTPELNAALLLERNKQKEIKFKQTQEKAKPSKFMAFINTLKNLFLDLNLPLIQSLLTMNVVLIVANSISAFLGIASGTFARYSEDRSKTEIENDANAKLVGVANKSNISEVTLATYNKLVDLEIIRQLNNVSNPEEVLKNNYSDLLQKAEQKVREEHPNIYKEMQPKSRFTRFKNLCKDLLHSMNPLERIMSYDEILQSTKENSKSNDANIDSVQLPKKNAKAKELSISPVVPTFVPLKKISEKVRSI